MTAIRVISILLIHIEILLSSGCLSAKIATSTGIDLADLNHKDEQYIISKIGKPFAVRTDVQPRVKEYFKTHGDGEVSFVDVVRYTGKLNTSEEGGTQYEVSGVTMGLGEIFLLPSTIADVAKRSKQEHVIYVFFDSQKKAIVILHDREIIGFEP